MLGVVVVNDIGRNRLLFFPFFWGLAWTGLDFYQVGRVTSVFVRFVGC